MMDDLQREVARRVDAERKLQEANFRIKELENEVANLRKQLTGSGVVGHSTHGFCSDKGSPRSSGVTFAAEKTILPKLPPRPSRKSLPVGAVFAVQPPAGQPSSSKDTKANFVLPPLPPRAPRSPQHGTPSGASSRALPSPSAKTPSPKLNSEPAAPRSKPRLLLKSKSATDHLQGRSQLRSSCGPVLEHRKKKKARASGLARSPPSMPLPSPSSTTAPDRDETPPKLTPPPSLSSAGAPLHKNPAVQLRAKRLNLNSRPMSTPTKLQPLHIPTSWVAGSSTTESPRSDRQNRDHTAAPTKARRSGILLGSRDSVVLEQAEDEQDRYR